MSTLNIPKQRTLVRQKYQKRCATPRMEDILNGLYSLFELEDEPQRLSLTALVPDLAQLIHHAWHAPNIPLGDALLDWFQKDFLEVSEIEAEEEMACRVPLSEQDNDAGGESEDRGAAT